jgi:hypothetical protein
VATSFLKSVTELYALIPNRDGPWTSVTELCALIPNRDGTWTDHPGPWKTITQEEKDKILSIEHKKYIEVDEKIIKKYMNQSVKLEKLIREFKI